MSWIRTASCPPVDDHYTSSRYHPEQSASLRDPAFLFMVPHGPHRTLKEALSAVSLQEERRLLLLPSLTLGRTSVLLFFAGLDYLLVVYLSRSHRIFVLGTFYHPGRATQPPTACMFLSSSALYGTPTPKWDSHQAPRQL